MNALFICTVCVGFFFCARACADDDLEGYDKLVTGRRKTGRVSVDYSKLLYILFGISLCLCLVILSLFLSNHLLCFSHISWVWTHAVEPPEWEGWNCTASSLHWGQLEADLLPGRAGELNSSPKANSSALMMWLYLKCLFFFCKRAIH